MVAPTVSATKALLGQMILYERVGNNVIESSRQNKQAWELMCTDNKLTALKLFDIFWIRILPKEGLAG